MAMVTSPVRIVDALADLAPALDVAAAAFDRCRRREHFVVEPLGVIGLGTS
jgi:hypothetical protein